MALIIFLLIFFSIWAFFFLPYAEKIPIWLKWKNPKRARWILIILFSLLPFGDEIIGRMQFTYLCNKGDLLYVSPKIKFTSRAKYIDPPDETHPLKYTIIPIEKATSRIIDIDTGDTIIQLTRFYTYGGLMLRAGFNFGHFSVCPSLADEADIKKYGFKLTVVDDDLIFIRNKVEGK